MKYQETFFLRLLFTNGTNSGRILVCISCVVWVIEKPLYVTQAEKRDLTCQNTFSQKTELKVYNFLLPVAGKPMA